MANKVKQYRKKRKLTQTELAYKTGVSQRYIAFIEANQRNPSLRLAQKIANVLGEKVDAISLP